jgi:Flp pilus assembly protein TadG
MDSFHLLARPSLRLRQEIGGSSLLEFAITLPLLVVFIVGIYDFSAAFNQKQKLEHAAHEGAILAGAQPTSDIETANADPESLHPVVTVVFNSLAANGVLPNANQGTCAAANATPTHTALQWTYTIQGCPDTVTILINRGWIPATADSTKSVGTLLTLTYPYHWRFNSVIQLLIPGASYSATTVLSETARVHNQL